MSEETEKPQVSTATKEVPESKEPKERDLSLVEDLPFTVAVEYGRTKITVDHFLNLRKNSVIEVDKLAGEALEFLMNGRVIAKGEAVVMNERYAIRLTDIVDNKQLMEEGS